MRVYIAGPISYGGALSTDQISDNVAVFAQAEEWLAKRGDQPLSPIQPDEYVSHRTWAENMRHALRLLLRAEGILLLPNWDKSRGARLEFQIATELGYSIEEYR